MEIVLKNLNLEIIELTWDFMKERAHLKAINAISFCDNATLAAANVTGSVPVFLREKELITKKKESLVGPPIRFLDELI